MTNDLWKLFLDDIRDPSDTSFVIARTVEEAQYLILNYGVPAVISFDHDLGMDGTGNLLPSGYYLAKWLVEMDMDEMIKIPLDFSFVVHSHNPIGAENIRIYLSNYLKSKNRF